MALASKLRLGIFLRRFPLPRAVETASVAASRLSRLGLPSPCCRKRAGRLCSGRGRILLGVQLSWPLAIGGADGLCRIHTGTAIGSHFEDELRPLPEHLGVVNVSPAGICPEVIRQPQAPVENVLEELDAPREWYFDSDTSTIYFSPTDGKAPADTEELFLPQLETIVATRGASQTLPVRNIRLEGLTFSHTLPGFMRPHEPTNGGDWAIRRAAALVLENAEGITVDSCKLTAVEGNGVLLSRYVRNSIVTRSELAGVGDTPLVLLGAADLMDGRTGNYPFGNELSHNYVHHFGVWNRQAAGYFEGLSRRNNVSFNVIHDGPRAGANFNDGFGGGLKFEGNLMFNVVQDTGEHGTTNSWDRAPMIWLDDNEEIANAPETRHIVRNFVFRNSFRGATSNKWCLDKDDGSSNYLEEGNVLIYGAVKDRDGLQRDVVRNLFLYPDKMPFTDTTKTKAAMAFQVSSFQFDSFVNNTVVSDLGEIYEGCGKFTKDPYPKGTPTMTGNTFITPGNPKKPFSAGGCSEGDNFEDWQAAGYDKGSKQSSQAVSGDDAVAMARRWLPPIAGGTTGGAAIGKSSQVELVYDTYSGATMFA